MHLVQILGANGSGKSTLLRTLAVSDFGAHLTHTSPILTVLPSYQLVLVGGYIGERFLKTPGVDRISSVDAQLAALRHATAMALSRAAGSSEDRWAVVWEGITICNMQWHPRYLAHGLAPVYVMLATESEASDIDLCFARIQTRSNKRREDLARNGATVLGKIGAVRNLMDWLPAQGALVLKLDPRKPAERLAEDIIGQLITLRWGVPRHAG